MPAKNYRDGDTLQVGRHERALRSVRVPKSLVIFNVVYRFGV